MNHSSVFTAAVVAALSLLSAQTGHAGDQKYRYDADVARTSYGIPHIRAADWGSLGYGYGYVFAQDNACVLARDVLVATGTQSRWFGAGANNANLYSDRVYRMVNSDARSEVAWARLDADTRALLTGYAEGYNRYLRDTGGDRLAADCRAQPWVRPLEGLDTLKVLRKLLVRAGTGSFVTQVATATPPAMPVADAAGSTAPAALLAASASADTAAPLIDPADLPDFSPERFGSNAVGLGGDLTGGAGALLGNPHFPWVGIERFYAVHLTIPGRYDVMGGSIFGFPLVNIGFNSNVAWSHTVSTARRFILRELALVPGNPRAYRYDGVAVEMQPEVVAVDVLQPDGSMARDEHTFWQTQFGPVVVPSPLIPWSLGTAYALTDINLENDRAFRQYVEMGQARDLGELRSALERHVGLPWVNTIAADSSGNAFYGDIGSIPNVSNAKLASCSNSPVARLLATLRVYTLDGSTSSCDPGTDADAPVPGVFGAGNLPGLMRRDFVQNSNDSYWLANPAERLEGFSRIIGSDEQSPQGFRTRLGLRQIYDRDAGLDDLPDTGFDRRWLQGVLFGNRHYSAEIMRPGVLQLCATRSPDVVIGDQTVNVATACEVLRDWDGRNDVASVGAHVWGELWRRLSGAPTAGSGLPAVANELYAVPFDVANPVDTPRDLNLDSAAVATRVMGELAYTVTFFADAGIPLTARWGDVQFEVRNGERIPIHGGSGTSGVYNAIFTAPQVQNGGLTPIVAGSSYIQAVTFRSRGPEAYAILTYSQSSNPSSPHFADMTELYSRERWVALPYKQGDISSDPNFKSFRLRARD
ncbi:MAG: penicillin acylase family protein [Pseudomonadales bacterium]|nr:penicillin acylase family protein [Pseudomonadales bacterium]